MFPRKFFSILICAILFSFALQVSMFGASVSFKKNAFVVVDASTGIPVSGVLVSAYGSNGSGYATTNNNGQFNITDGLPSGNYTVTTYKEGYVNAEDDNVMVIAGSETSGVTLYVSLSGGVFGRITDNVTGQGIPSTIVFVLPTSGSSTYFWEGLTDSLGYYSIYTNLGTGSYNVSVYSPTGYIAKTTGPVFVTAGQKTNGVNLSLQRSGIISGRITTPGGQGLANLTVQAFDQTYSNFGSAQTNATGYYRIASGMATSNYTVMVMSGVNINSTAQPPLDALYPDGVVVTAGLETSNVDLELTIAAPPSSGIIMGKVMDLNNNPIPYASVTATGETLFDSGSATADKNGNYTISEGLVDTDTYTVEATANGYESENFTGVSVVVNQVTTVDFHLQAIPPSQSGRISGTVTGDANPITPEFQYLIAMMLVATLAAVAFAKSFNRRIKYRNGLKTEIA